MRRSPVIIPGDKSHALVGEIFSGLNNKDTDELVSLFSEEASLSFPGSSSLSGFHLGKKKIRKFFQKLFILVPDICFSLKSVVSNDRLIAVEWISTGISKRNIPFEDKGATFIELRDGKIKEMRLYPYAEKLKGI